MYQQRYYIVDYIKGLSVLFMIQVHVLELFAAENIYSSTYGKFSLFLGSVPVAPLLMVFLGYFLFDTNKSSSQLFWRGTKLFLLGMLLNLLLNFNLIYSVCNNKFQINIWPYVFGVDILHFAGLSIIILACFRKILEKYRLIPVILIIVIILISNFQLQLTLQNNNLKYILSYFFGCSNWSYFPLFPWLAYPLVGVSIKNYFNNNLYKKILNKQKYILGLIVLTTLILSLPFAVKTASNLQSYYHHDVLFFLWSIIFIAMYFQICDLSLQLVFIKKISLPFIWLGKNITLIYFIQWFIIGNLATEIYKTVNNVSYLLLYFTGITMLSVIVSFLCLKLYSCKKLFTSI